MTLFHIIILAVVQGITEFLPISSSAHLVLLHNIFEDGSLQNAEQDRLMDIAVHIGTLLAVLIFFYHEVFAMLRGLGDVVKHKSLLATENSRLMTLVVLGSIPAILVGFVVYEFVDPEVMYDPHIIMWTTLIFGVLLGLADYIGKTNRVVSELTIKDTLIIGLAQCLSLIPGTSRSGITMTAGRFLGMNRVEAARFSLLLAMVITSAVGFAGILDLFKMENVTLTTDAAIAAFLSFLTAIAMIWLMMKGLTKFSFMPYVIYRLILGGILVWVLYF